jgi:hypothetical protein
MLYSFSTKRKFFPQPVLGKWIWQQHRACALLHIDAVTSAWQHVTDRKGTVYSVNLDNIAYMAATKASGTEIVFIGGRTDGNRKPTLRVIETPEQIVGNAWR